MARLVPVDFDPFDSGGARLTPVDFDPFAEQPRQGSRSSWFREPVSASGRIGAGPADSVGGRDLESDGFNLASLDSVNVVPRGVGRLAQTGALAAGLARDVLAESQDSDTVSPFGILLRRALGGAQPKETKGLLAAEEISRDLQRNIDEQFPKPQAQAQTERELSQATGVMDTLGALVRNPRGSLELAAESLASSLPAIRAAGIVAGSGLASGAAATSAGEEFDNEFAQFQQTPMFEALRSAIGDENVAKYAEREKARRIQQSLIGSTVGGAATAGVTSRIGLNPIDEAIAGRAGALSSRVPATVRETAGEAFEGGGTQAIANLFTGADPLENVATSAAMEAALGGLTAAPVDIVNAGSRAAGLLSDIDTIGTQAADLTRQAQARATTDRILGRTTPPQTPQEAQTDAGAGIAEAAIANARAARPAPPMPIAQSDVRENDELDRLLVGALGGVGDGNLLAESSGLGADGGAVLPRDSGVPSRPIAASTIQDAQGSSDNGIADLASSIGLDAENGLRRGADPYGNRDYQRSAFRTLPDGTYFIPGDHAAIRQRLADAGVETRGVVRTIDEQQGVRFGANTRGQVLGVLGGSLDTSAGIGAQALGVSDRETSGRGATSGNRNEQLGPSSGGGLPARRADGTGKAEFDVVPMDGAATNAGSLPPATPAQPTQAEAAVDGPRPEQRGPLVAGNRGSVLAGQESGRPATVQTSDSGRGGSDYDAGIPQGNAVSAAEVGASGVGQSDVTDARARFRQRISPAVRRDQAVTQKLQSLKQSGQLSDEQIALVRETLSPELSVGTDRVTTFFRSEDLPETMQAAQQYVTETNDDAAYAEIDFANLGGLNAVAGNVGADKHLAAVTRIIKEGLEAAGVDGAVNIRKGGDEFGIIAAGMDSQALGRVMMGIRQQVSAYADVQGLSGIAHGKDKSLPPGIGIHFATSDIQDGLTVDEIRAQADTLVEARKKGLANYDEYAGSDAAVGSAQGTDARTGISVAAATERGAAGEVGRAKGGAQAASAAEGVARGSESGAESSTSGLGAREGATAGDGRAVAFGRGNREYDVAGSSGVREEVPAQSIERDGLSVLRNDTGGTVDEVRSAVSRALGSKFLRRLESQPWFNLVESLDQLPPDVRKSISGDDIAGFVLPDGRVFIIAENVGDNATGIVLHEVGVHFGMAGLPDFLAMLAKFRSMRKRDAAVDRAYRSVPKDTDADLIDEEAFAYYVEQNWNAKTPLMTRIKDAIARLLNRLGVPTSGITDALMRQALDGMVQSAREAADRAARGLVTVLDGKIVYAEGGKYSRRADGGSTIEVDGVERPTTDSTGKPIHPTDEGLRNFWRWFGSSRVVDGHGRPDTQYKGMWPYDWTKETDTNKGPEVESIDRPTPFPAFNKGEAGIKISGFFGDKETASRFAGIAGGTGGAVFPVYLRITNPYEIDADGASAGDIQFGESGANFRNAVRSGKYDGIIIRNTKDEGTVYVALSPTQIKSATGNSGSFSPTDKRIAYSRRTPQQAQAESAQKQGALAQTVGATPGQTFAAQDRFTDDWKGALRKAREKIQDKLLSVRDVQEDVEKVRGAVTDAMNVYRRENLMHGRVGQQRDELERTHIKPLLDAMAKAKVTPELLEDYVEARHAEERNKAIAAKQGGMPDAGAGMTTQAAADFLAGNAAGHRSGVTLTPDLTRTLDRLARRVDAITAETRQRLYQSGQITKQQLTELENAYQFYVPLRGKDGEEDAARGGTGKGIDVRGKPIQRALGRGDGNRAINILAEVVADAERSIITAEKARVGRTLARLVIENPNPDVWSIEPVKVEQAYSESADEIYLAVKSLDQDPNTIIVKASGKPYRIYIEDTRIAEALKNLSAEQLPIVVQIAAGLNRYFSAVLTRYNPSFVAVNLVRDMIFGMTGIAAENGAKQAADAAKNYLPAMRSMWREARGTLGNSRMDRYADEFSRAGGKTYFGKLENVPDIAQRIGMEFKTARQIAFGERRPVAAIGKLAKDSRIVQAIENANDAVENALRLAAYAARREAGASVEQAAEYAKNITVNFNRRGAYTSWLNALYLFFNASVQGTHRVFRLLKNRKVQAALGGLALAQAVFAMMAMGYDDEDGEPLWDSIPEWEKQRNFIIVYPYINKDGKVRATTFKIPMPYGFNIFPYLGGRTAALANDIRNDKKHAIRDYINDSAAGVLGAMAPLPFGEEGGFKAWLPHWLRLAGMLSENKDDLGIPIRAGEEFDRYDRPRSAKGRDDTSEVFKMAATALNRIGGGDDYNKPMFPWLLDWAPEDLEFIAATAGGGLSGTALKGQRMTEKLIAGVPVRFKDVPILSSFVSNVDQRQATSSRYYERKDEIERQIAQQRDIAKETGNVEDNKLGIRIARNKSGQKIKRGEGYELEGARGSLFATYKEAEKEIARIRDEMRATYRDSSIDFGERARRIDALKVEREEVQREVNAKWREVFGRKSR